MFGATSSFSSSLAKSFSRSYATVPSKIGAIKTTLRAPKYNSRMEGPVESADVFKNKKVVVIGIPGAFTPICSTKHIPGFINKAAEFKAAGVSDIVVLSVNDHHVMRAWENSLNNNGALNFLADPEGNFTRSINQEVDLTANGLGKRSERYAIYVDNGTVKVQLVENNVGELKDSTAESMLNHIKSL